MTINDISTKTYWTKRYKEENTGWDIGYVSKPLKNYFDQLTNKDLRILIPGAGNAYEAEYLFKNGFENVYIMDISELPILEFKQRNPNFPVNQILHEDFFAHTNTYDLIIEQTFFCSFPPLQKTRKTYAKQMANLLSSNGKLVGLWFDIPLNNDLEKRPFGGTKKDYLSYFEIYLTCITFNTCFNSIPQRKGKELFGIFKLKR